MLLSELASPLYAIIENPIPSSVPPEVPVIVKVFVASTIEEYHENDIEWVKEYKHHPEIRMKMSA